MNKINVKDIRLVIGKRGGCILVAPKANHLDVILHEPAHYLERVIKDYFKDGMQELGICCSESEFVLFGEGRVVIPDCMARFDLPDEEIDDFMRYPGTSETADVMSAEDFVLLCNMMNYFQTFLSKQIKAGRGIWKGVTFDKTVTYNPWTGEFEDPIEDEEQS